MSATIPGGPPPGPGPAGEPPLTRWQKFRMVVKVVELRVRFLALMAATGLVFGYWDTLWNYYEKWSRPAASRVAAASGEEFYCPMHPAVVQEHPGLCPICGMPLSRRKKGEATTLPEGVTARVQLSPERVAQAGVRTVAVGYAPLAETLTTVGFVEHDETRYARISSKIKGMSRIEALHVGFNGMPVRAGQPLADLYSPELYQAMQELLLASRSAQQARQRPASGLGSSLLRDPDELLRPAVEKLRLWGIDQAQIDRVLREGRAAPRVTITSPIGGHVLKKNVVPGQYVAEGEALFEVADLAHVWVKARVFEDQFGLIRVGQAVEATVPAFPDAKFAGAVAFIDPMLDPETRTVGVRYDLENADHRLRPGMFAMVALRTPLAGTPAFARLTRGATPPPSAEPTPAEQKVCPVTGQKLGSMGDPVRVSLAKHKLWLCCEGCEPALKARPDQYLARIAAPPAEGVLSVPESAVIDTGARTVVYVETRPGVFDGRTVVLGPRSGDRYPVLDGLLPGEKVAAAGAFLIDAESRLNPGRSTTDRAEKTPPSPGSRGGGSD